MTLHERSLGFNEDPYSTALRIITFQFLSLSLSSFFTLGKFHFVSTYQILNYSSFLQDLAPTLQINISNFSQPSVLASLRTKAANFPKPCRLKLDNLIKTSTKNQYNRSCVGNIHACSCCLCAAQGPMSSTPRKPHNWLPKYQVSTDASSAP